MKQSLHQLPMADTRESDDFDDDEFKDVFHPQFDELPGETSAIFNLRFEFAIAGYTARCREAETHPILVVRLTCQSAHVFPDEKLFTKFLQSVLRRAGHRLRPNELTVRRKGNSVLLAFPWSYSSIDYAAGLRLADQEALQIADMDYETPQ
jgi:hypothetical protein